MVYPLPDFRCGRDLVLGMFLSPRSRSLPRAGDPPSPEGEGAGHLIHRMCEPPVRVWRLFIFGPFSSGHAGLKSWILSLVAAFQVRSRWIPPEKESL